MIPRGVLEYIEKKRATMDLTGIEERRKASVREFDRAHGRFGERMSGEQADAELEAMMQDW